MSRGIHPALTSAADEVCGTLARVIAYVMTLALIGILGLALCDRLPRLEASEPARTGWAVASRSYPAYAVSRLDSDEKSGTYEIVRHPEGGRKDILRWIGTGDRQGDREGERTAAELEIYRIGAEADSGPDLAARMPSAGPQGLEAAGVIDSKFGTMALLRPVGVRDNAGACLGFLKRFDEPAMQISGWSCHGSSTAMRRAAVSCLLNRLTLLASGNDPKLGEFFARAELKRGSCGNPALAAEPADWVKRADGPRLRGAL
jgi:hypothetical protein